MSEDGARAAVKRAENRYDVVRAEWAADPSPDNARRLDLARTAMFDARREASRAR